MKFLIIGGDAAGMSAASRAKRHLPEMDVQVLEKTRDVSYSACGMPYNIADAGRDMDDLVVRPADVFRRKQGIDLLTEHQVLSIDPQAKTVSGKTGAGEPFGFGYDKLLIATGASPLMPDVPGVALPGVMALKNLEDGRRLKAYLARQTVRKALIIGMGYIGLEMVEALRRRGVAVDMVKPGPVFLPWMQPMLAEVVRETVTDNGVGLYAGHPVEAIEHGGDGLRVICRERTFSADLVLCAIGVAPNSQIAAAAGLALGLNGAIAVDRRLRTSNADIYAAGDCADAYHLVTGKKTWVPLALRANRAGWAVADNICGRPVALPGIAGTAVFKVFDLQVARTGLSQREALDAGFEPVDVQIQARSRAHAHPGAATISIQMLADKKSGRLLGAQMVGREGVAHRINAVAVALHNRMTVADFAQTDLAYAPPFSPVWDPLLTTANQLMKKL